MTTTPLCSQPGEEYRVGMCDVGPHYDPTGNGPTGRANYSIECTRQTPEMCEIGDLTGKHTTINISGESQQTLVCRVLETQSSRLAHITIVSHTCTHAPHMYTCTHHTHTAVPATFATNSFFFTDTFLNLTGVYAVEGRALAIHEENRGKQA